MSQDAGSVRRWFRTLRSTGARRDLDTFLLDGNDGAGYVYLYDTPGMELWMDRGGWARYQRGEQIARRFRDLQRTRTGPHRRIFPGIVD